MLKKILLAILVIILLAIVFVYIRTRPSGNMNDYAGYFADDKSAPDSNAVKVTYLGATTLLFDDGETQFLFDGFFSRPSLWTALTSEIQSDTATIDQVISNHHMDRVKGIFVAHTHFDHSFDVAYTTKKTGAILYGSVSTLNVGRGGGVNESELSEFKPNQEIQLGRFTVKVIPSKHSPGNALKDDGVIIASVLRQPAKMKAYSEGGSFDFYIIHHGKSIYVKPSPNYIAGALDTINADILFLGVGIVAKQPPAWQEAYYDQTVGKLKPSVVVPIHWDNFFKPLSKPLEMLPKFAAEVPKDFDFFIEKTKADKIDFKILQGGKSIIIK